MSTVKQISKNILTNILWCLVVVENVKTVDRRLATGNVQCVCSATYQIIFNIFDVIDHEAEPRTLTLNPKP